MLLSNITAESTLRVFLKFFNPLQYFVNDTEKCLKMTFELVFNSPVQRVCRKP